MSRDVSEQQEGRNWDSGQQEELHGGRVHVSVGSVAVGALVGSAETRRGFGFLNLFPNSNGF